VERNFVCVGVEASRVIRACFMKKEKMKNSRTDNYEWEEKVEGEETGEGGVVNRKASSDSLDKRLPSVRDGREKVSNYRSPSERHLSSREDVAYESSYHCKKQENNTDVSSFFIEVRAIIKASSDMQVDANKEERCAVGVYVSDKSAVVYVPADVGNG